MNVGDIIAAHHSSGTYAKLVPDEITKKRIVTVINMLNIDNAISEEGMHTTVVYSRFVCPEIEGIQVDFPIVGHGIAFDVFGKEGEKCLVLKLQSEEMTKLHTICREEYGATHDFPQYDPHITLSYDYPHEALPNSSLLEYFKNLTFDNYIVEPLEFDWIELIEP